MSCGKEIYASSCNSYPVFFSRDVNKMTDFTHLSSGDSGFTEKSKFKIKKMMKIRGEKNRM